MPQVYDQGYEVPRRRRREDEEPVPFGYAPAELAVREGPGPLYGRLAAAEAASRRRLHTTIVYGLALATGSDPDAARAGATLAREMDLPTFGYRNRAGKAIPMVDPSTGQPLTWAKMRSARLMAEGEMAAQIAGVIERLEHVGVQLPLARPVRDPDGNIARYRTVPITADEIADAAEALTPLKGNLSAREGLAYAIGIATDGTDRELLRANLEVLVAWNGDTGPLTEAQMVGIANSWSRDTDKVLKREDIVAIVDPDVAMMRKQMEDLTPSERDFLLENGLDLKAWEKAQRAGELAILGAAHRSEYLELADESLAALGENTDEGFVHDVVMGALHTMDRILQIPLGAVYNVIGSAGPYGLGTSVAERERRRNEMIDIWMGRDRFGDQYAQDLGFERGTGAHALVSAGAEFALGWFLDPLVVAGQARRFVSLRNVIRPTKADLAGLGVFKTAARIRSGRLRENLVGITNGMEDWGASAVPRTLVERVGMPTRVVRPPVVEEVPLARVVKGQVRPLRENLGRGRVRDLVGVPERTEFSYHDQIIARFRQVGTAETPGRQITELADDIYALVGRSDDAYIGARTSSATELVKVIDDQVVGSLRYIHDSGEIILYVLPQFRRQGVATSLVTSAADNGLIDFARMTGQDATSAGAAFAAHVAAQADAAKAAVRVLPASPTIKEWLAHAAVKDVDLISTATIGMSGRAEGVQREVAAYMHKIMNEVHGGVVTPEAIDDVWDIMLASVGLPMRSAGATFKRYYIAGTEASFLSAIDDTVKRVLLDPRRKITMTKAGTLHPNSVRSLRSALAKELKNVGLSDAATGKLVERTLKFLRKSDLDFIAGTNRTQALVDMITGASPFAGGKLRQAAVRQMRETIADELKRMGIGGKRVGRFSQKLTSLDETAFNALRNASDKELNSAIQRMFGATPLSEDALTMLRGVVRHPVGMTALSPAQLRAVGKARGAVTWEDTIVSNLSGVQRSIPRALPMLQHMRDARLSIARSGYWRSKVAQHFVEPIFQRAPKNWVDIEDFMGDRMLARTLRTYGADDEMIAELRAEFIRIQNAPVRTREAAFVSLIERIRDNYYRNVLGLPEQLAEAVVRSASQSHRFAVKSAQLYSVIRDLKTGHLVWLEKPPLETMLPNVLMLPNPRQLEVSLKRLFGGIEGMRDLARLTLKTDDIFSITNTQDMTRLIEAAKADRWARVNVFRGKTWDTTKRATDALRSGWVSAQLLRVGWPVKVLLDENFRALVTLHSLVDRMSGIADFHVFGKSLGFGPGKIVEKLGLARPVDIAIPMRNGTSKTLTIPIPYKFADEAAVSQGMTLNSWMRSVSQQSNIMDRQLREIYELLSPSSGERYWDTLHLFITNRIHQSTIGPKVLSMIATQPLDGVVYDMARIQAWARTDETFRRFVGNQNMEEMVDQAVSYITYYVSSNPAVARRALEGTLDIDTMKQLMRNIPDDQLPSIVMREAEQASLFQMPVATTLRDKLFDILMRGPSDWGSRNPLYKVLLAQEIERVVGIEIDRGRVFTEEEFAEIAAMSGPIFKRAQKYALTKELDVMFSYLNRSQFAEATRFIMPFFSAFEEQIAVWGKLLWDNPQTVGRFRQFWDAATESGMIYRDPDNDEWVVNKYFLAGAIAVGTMFNPVAIASAAAVYGGTRAATELLDLPNVDWIYPLAPFNVFLSDSFSIPVGGDNIPLPVPGFSPPAQMMIQLLADKVYPDSWLGKSRIMDWAFKYGPDPSIMPATWERLLTAVLVPEGNAEFRRTEHAMWDNFVLQGGTVAGLSTSELKDLEKRMHTQARQFIAIRAFAGLLNPVSPRVDWPVEEAREKFYNDVEEWGWDKAVEILKSVYPDSPDILLAMTASTFWESNLPKAPDLPTNDLVAELMKHPEFAEAARAHPEFAFWLIPSEFRAEGTDFNFNLYGKVMAEGIRKIEEPALFDRTGLTGGRVYEYMRRQGWNEYDAVQDAFLRHLRANGISTDPDSTAYKDEARNYGLDEQVAEIADKYPPWDEEFVKIYPTGVSGEDRLAIGMLRAMTTWDGWKDTGFGKAMTEYFTVRDRIYEDMLQKDITGLQNVGARKEGLRQEFNTLITDLTRRYGEDFTLAYETWLSGDLQKGLEVKADEPKVPTNYSAHHTRWEAKWDRWRAVTGGQYIDELDRNEAFAHLRDLSIRAAAWSERKTGDPFDERANAQMRWWLNMDGGDPARREYAMSVAMKPYVFLSPFERNVVLGLESTGYNEKLWAEVEKRKLDVYRANDADPDHTDEHWDEYNRWVDDFLKANPDFDRTELKRSQTWGFTVWHAIEKYYPKWMEGHDGEAWAAMREVSEGVREIFRDQEFVDDSEFMKVRGIMRELVEELSKVAPLFGDQWKRLQEFGGGDSLMDTLFPEFWWVKL